MLRREVLWSAEILRDLEQEPLPFIMLLELVRHHARWIIWFRHVRVQLLHRAEKVTVSVHPEHLKLVRLPIQWCGSALLHFAREIYFLLLCGVKHKIIVVYGDWVFIFSIQLRREIRQNLEVVFTTLAFCSILLVDHSERPQGLDLSHH